MPKVSEAHREARRQQIQAAAIRCVAREGFHKTTMAAVIRESGLSAGAVYLYFRGKQDLIRAIAETAIIGVADAVSDLADAAEVVAPPEALRVTTQRVIDLGAELGVELPRVAIQAWAEAARDPEVLALVAAEGDRIRSAWVSYVERAATAGHLRPDVDAPRVARTLMGLIPGFMIQRVVFEDLQPEEYAAGLAELLR